MAIYKVVFESEGWEDDDRCIAVKSPFVQPSSAISTEEGAVGIGGLKPYFEQIAADATKARRISLSMELKHDAEEHADAKEPRKAEECLLVND